ncbi:TonB-dependent receptor [Danxiaibacter flavus]|uniref:TonB-dependent receptor n=1 Tax=Danxiaibacter flavus TaxID=3049108 RepID=A0ABV3ZFF5_9BACT|nr:TonB-dependent receptor [Chitinophagaceae bacterium DXS]
MKKSPIPSMTFLLKTGVMALCVTFLFINVLFARRILSQEVLEKKVTLIVQNQKLETAINMLEEQVGIKFNYSSRVIDINKKVSFSLSNMTLKSLLDGYFKTIGIGYKLVNNHIVLFEENSSDLLDVLHGAVFADNINGRVVDENGNPVNAASITIKGTTRGTTTNEKGEFTLRAETGDVLEIISLNFTPSSYIVKSHDKDILITLTAVIGDLADVVVIGYGVQKKEALTGAIGVIKASQLGDRVSASPATLLQGLTPGVNVMQSGGYPGAGAGIKIREVASWNGTTDPLFVIDGIIRDKNVFAALNPADIDNISILKDAASASIYGMQAGNGVVLVTTKRGSSEKTQISYSGSYTFNKPTVIPGRMSAYDNFAFHNSILSQRNIPQTDPQYYTPDELEYFKTHSYDWLANTWQTPNNTNHLLSVSGGSKAIRYYVSGGYLSQNGATSNSYNKYNLIAKLDGQINSSLSFMLDLNASWDNGSRPYWPADGGALNLGNTYNRILMVIPSRPDFINGLPVGNLDNTNVANLAKGAGGYIRPANNYLSPTFQLKYNIPGIKGLSAKGVFAYNTYNGYSRTFANAPYIYYFKTAGEHKHIITDQLDSSRAGGYKVLDGAVVAGTGAPQQLSETWQKNSNYQLDLMLNYARAFGKHNISGFIGYEQLSGKGQIISGRAAYYNNIDYQQIDGGSTSSVNRYVSGNQQNLNGQASYFGRLDYNYDGRYMIGVTFRADGSYIFPPDKRWGYFPAASAAWNISNESFFQAYKKTIDYLKLRVSYGLTGSNNTNPWQWQQAYNFKASSGAYIGNSMTPGISLGGTTNPNITWEKNYNTNVGIDIALPDRLVSATVEYWYKKTTDILGARNASVPATVGATLPAVNYGQASAKGWEINVNHEKQFDDFFYKAGINWSTSSNKYLLVDQPTSVRSLDNKIGNPVNGLITGYVSEGIIRTQAQADAILAKTPGFTTFGYKPQPGMLLYKDIRGPYGKDTPDGIIDANDQIPISYNSVPRINYGFNITAGWKNIQVTAIFAGMAKYDIMPVQTFARDPYTLQGYNTLSMWKDAWTPQTAETATLPSAAMNDVSGMSNAEVQSTFWLTNGAFLRFKTLLINYNLPAKWFKNTQLQSARFYFNAENLFCWNHTGYYDPELGGDFRLYPLMKNFTFGANINF